MPVAEALPRVTPFLVRDAETMCARRLRRHYQRLKGDEGEMLRGRVRDRFVADARAAHHEMGPPRPASFRVSDDLLPEEQAVQSRAIDHYLALFGGEELRAIDHSDVERAAVSSGGEYEVGGWIDLVGERPGGGLELRQFELWGNAPVADPARNATVLLAAMRIRKVLRAERLAVRAADLVRGRLDEHEVDFEGLGALFHQRMMRIRLRVGDGSATAGHDCVTCPYVQGCPALR